MKKYLLALSLCMVIGAPAICMAGKGTEELAILDGGDRVYREEDTVIVEFSGERDVISSSLINGGYRKDLVAVLNNHSNDGPMTVARPFESFAYGYRCSDEKRRNKK
jgi:hypothetical protein